MKFSALLLTVAAVQAVQLEQTDFTPSGFMAAAPYEVVNNKIYLDGCPTPVPNTVEELNIQLEEFGRSIDKTHYNKAMAIYGELTKMGKDPKVRVNTYEMLDKAFAFERVRRYDLVQQHMALVEHLQDNLNQNFTNGQNVDQFILVARAAIDAFNAKYHNGEFSDPGATGAMLAVRDPPAATWSSVKF
jgi:hypothetical protein